MSLHPKTLAALEAGPQEWWNKDGTIVTKQESPTDFARRIALIAMEEEREACERICIHTDMDPSIDADFFANGASACAKAIRRRGKP